MIDSVQGKFSNSKHVIFMNWDGPDYTSDLKCFKMSMNDQLPESTGGQCRQDDFLYKYKIIDVV